MKKFLLIFVILFFTQTSYASGSYGGMWGNSGYSSSSYSSSNGISRSSYSSAASSSSRYSATHSSYGMGASRNASYHSSSGAGYGAYAVPSATKSYGSSYTGSYGGYSSVPSYKTNSPYNQASSSYKRTSVSNNLKAAPFRYNTLDYTRSRKMDADPPKRYSAKCTDMGDASFCQ